MGSLRQQHLQNKNENMRLINYRYPRACSFYFKGGSFQATAEAGGGGGGHVSFKENGMDKAPHTHVLK